MKKKEEEFEAYCKRCGACCGALDGDPCSKLGRDADLNYVCTSYVERFGPQKTVKGKFFNCVSIKEYIRDKSLRQGCGYIAYK